MLMAARIDCYPWRSWQSERAHAVHPARCQGAPPPRRGDVIRAAPGLAPAPPARAAPFQMERSLCQKSLDTQVKTQKRESVNKISPDERPRGSCAVGVHARHDAAIADVLYSSIDQRYVAFSVVQARAPAQSHRVDLLPGACPQRRAGSQQGLHRHPSAGVR